MEYITKNREREDEGGLEGSQSAKMLDGNIIERGSVIDLTYHSGYNNTEETLVLYCIFFFYALADTFIQSEIQQIALHLLMFNDMSKNLLYVPLDKSVGLMSI